MSSKRTCPACAKPFIKGVRVLFAARTGARGATVCKRCAEGGLLVVQDKSGDLTKCMYCETNAAVACLVCCVPTSTHLNPVGATLEWARGIAKARLEKNPAIPSWTIRKGYDGYYVVPPMEVPMGTWRVDPGYEAVGAYVEQVYR